MKRRSVMAVMVVFLLCGFVKNNNLFASIYWTDTRSKKIQRANYDGSEVEDLVTTGLYLPFGLDLDVSAGKMYWADGFTDKILRSNLDGSNIETLYKGSMGPYGITVDFINNHVYWTENRKIKRANLDGSGVTDIVTGLSSTHSVAIDTAGNKIYWTDYKKISRANLDGSGKENLVTYNHWGPESIALDVSAGKMYWTDDYDNTIKTANLDGSGVTNLVTTGLISPRDIALDISIGKMFWADVGNGKIKMANLDGSEVTDIIVSSSPFAIAIPEPVNSPPLADAGEDQVAYACAGWMAEVKLDGSGSYDVDGDELEYFWFKGDEQIATGVDPNVQLPVGEHIIDLVVDDGTESSEPNAVVITVIGPVEADVHIVPRTINRRNRTKRIMAIIRLPEGIKKQDIADEPFMLEPGGIEAIWDRVIGRGNQATVFALFDKDEVMAELPNTGSVELTVIGKLTSGRCIYGTDTVRIVQPLRQRWRSRIRR